MRLDQLLIAVVAHRWVLLAKRAFETQTSTSARADEGIEEDVDAIAAIVGTDHDRDMAAAATNVEVDLRRAADLVEVRLSSRSNVFEGRWKSVAVLLQPLAKQLSDVSSVCFHSVLCAFLPKAAFHPMLFLISFLRWNNHSSIDSLPTHIYA